VTAVAEDAAESDDDPLLRYRLTLANYPLDPTEHGPRSKS
jgi:hypothetical protein